MTKKEALSLWDAPMAGRNGTLRELFHAMGNKGYDPAAYIATEMGAATPELWETLLTSADEMGPEVLDYWKRRGMEKRLFGETPEDRWALYLPERAAEPGSETFPLLFIFTPGAPIFELEGHGYIQEAAKRGCIAVTVQTYEEARFLALYRKLTEEYPVDRSRVYVTGFSGGGERASLASLTHPELFAASCPAGNHCMLESFYISYEQIEKVKLLGMPVLLISGLYDISEQFPLYRNTSDLYDCLPSSEPTYKNVWMPRHREAKVLCLRARLYVTGCRDVSFEDCCAQEYSDNIVCRNFGIPFEKTSVKNIQGVDHYIGEFTDRKGRTVFRAVCLDLAPHQPTPSYAPFAFDFFFRFRRDPETGILEEVSP